MNEQNISTLLTAAAIANMDETGTDAAADIAAIRSGSLTKESLLAHCLDGADSDRVQGWREYVEAIVIAAAEQPKQRLAWGLQPDRKYLAAWGARSIFERDGRGKLSVDILWDRQDGIGLPADQKALQAWLNKTGLRLLRKAVEQERLQPNDRRRINVNQGPFRIIADPQASYGYLYICAMMLPKEDSQL